MSINPKETLFKELSLYMLLISFTGALSVGIIFQDLKIVLSFLTGALLAYLNFITLRKEGQEFLWKVYQNVMLCVNMPYQKERTYFLIKTYLRLLALGIIFYFLIAKFSLHPLFLILGFTLVYFQIFVVTLKMWLKRKESF